MGDGDDLRRRARARTAPRWPRGRGWRSACSTMAREVEEYLAAVQGCWRPWTAPRQRDRIPPRRARRLGARGDAITKTFEHGDFVGSVEFVDALVEPAEEMGHHPDLKSPGTRSSVSITNHAAGGLTANDFELAKRIDALDARRPREAGRQLRSAPMRILHVVGTRPNLVKMAPVIAALRERFPEWPDVDRPHRPALRPADVGDLPRGARRSASPTTCWGSGRDATRSRSPRVLERLEPVLRAERPDLVLVPGDVNSTLGGGALRGEAGNRGRARRVGTAELRPHDA